MDSIEKGMMKLKEMSDSLRFSGAQRVVTKTDLSEPVSVVYGHTDYKIGPGAKIWKLKGQMSGFYVTLEDQAVQLQMTSSADGIKISDVKSLHREVRRARTNMTVGGSRL